MKTIHLVKDEPIPLDEFGGVFGYCEEFPLSKVIANYVVSNKLKLLKNFSETFDEHPNMQTLEYPLNLAKAGGQYWFEVSSLLNSLKDFLRDGYNFKNPISHHWCVSPEMNNGKGFWRCHPGTTRLFIAKLFEKEKPHITSWIYADDEEQINGFEFEPLPTYRDLWNKTVDKCVDAVEYRNHRPLVSLIAVQMLNDKIQPYGKYPNIAIGLEHVAEKDLSKTYYLAKNFFEHCELTVNGKIVQSPIKEKLRTVRCRCGSFDDKKRVKIMLLSMLCDKYKCPEDDFWFKTI